MMVMMDDGDDDDDDDDELLQWVDYDKDDEEKEADNAEYKHLSFRQMGHSAHLGTATCPSSKLVPKFEKGDNLMKHVYLAYGGNG